MPSGPLDRLARHEAAEMLNSAPGAARKSLVASGGDRGHFNQRRRARMSSALQVAACELSGQMWPDIS